MTNLLLIPKFKTSVLTQKDMQCKCKKCIVLHQFTSFFLVPHWSCKNIQFFIFVQIGLIKQNWGNPHHPSPQKVNNFFKENVQLCLLHYTFIGTKFQTSSAAMQKTAAWGGVNNKPTVENNEPGKCTTANNKLTICTVSQKKALCQSLPLKILTILHPKMSWFPPHQLNCSNNIYLISKKLQQLTFLELSLGMLKYWLGNRAERTLIYVGKWILQKSLSPHLHVASCFENSPWSGPCKGMRSLSWITFDEFI